MLLLLQATTTPGAAPAPQKPPEKVTCRYYEETGSRVGGKRVCRTAAEWRQQENDAQQSLEDFHRSSSAPAR
ncbi:MAG: hypothetical protein P0Y64_02815 [Candidatus Sphingomonas colombiensis]|nr:hypothetical protein [Sphingomonas sp.]WEK43780.1 MAG: hypothetical protein P0Y64_02815 [Sphingomonas sp.]